MAKKQDIRPAAIAVGAGVTIGILYLATRKRKRCKQMSGVWSKHAPLHLTEDAQEEAFAFARHRLASHLVGSDSYKLSDITLQTAEHLEEDCDWEGKLTKKQEQVFEGIDKIVHKVSDEAKSIGPAQFSAKYGGGGTADD